MTPAERPSYASGARPGDVGDPRDGYDEVAFFNPLLLFGRTLGVGYERVLDPRYSVLGGLRLTHYGWPVDDGENDRYRLDGLSAYIQPHIYPWARAPRGFYLAPYTSLSYYDVRDTQGDDDFTFNSTEVGATLGWSWLIRRFNIKLGLGAGYYWADEQRRNDVSYTGNDFRLTGDLDFGIAF